LLKAVVGGARRMEWTIQELGRLAIEIFARRQKAECSLEQNGGEIDEEEPSMYLSKLLKNIPVLGFMTGEGEMGDGTFIICIGTILLVAVSFMSHFICIYMGN
jgi:hypothetical protein